MWTPWYHKAEILYSKNKNQNAGSPQNHTPQGQPKNKNSPHKLEKSEEITLPLVDLPTLS